jgi:hypothetical protein
MRRREFIALGSAFFSLPIRALAQNLDRPRRIAMMIAPAEDDPEGQARVAAFRNALQLLGWIEGQNLQIDYRGSNQGLFSCSRTNLASEPVEAASGRPVRQSTVVCLNCFSQCVFATLAAASS